MLFKMEKNEKKNINVIIDNVDEQYVQRLITLFPFLFSLYILCSIFFVIFHVVLFSVELRQILFNNTIIDLKIIQTSEKKLEKEKIS